MKKIIRFVALMLTACLVFTGCNETDTGEGQGSKVTGAVQNHDGSDPGALKVYCFELGKADSFLIYNKQTTIIIDAGERGQGKDILQYMENNDIKGIDMMFITHFDKDHVGGAAKLIGNTEVKEVYTPVYIKPSDDYDNFFAPIQENCLPLDLQQEIEASWECCYGFREITLSDLKLYLFKIKKENSKNSFKILKNFIKRIESYLSFSNTFFTTYSDIKILFWFDN